MKRRLQIVLAVLLTAVSSAAAQSDVCSRIVTLAPSLTESVYALNLGDRVVGVSGFSEYPPEALAKPRVGALLDPNFEAILALRPTLVLALSEFRDKIPYLESLGVKTLTLEHRSLQGIADSLLQIGVLCGKEAEGRERAQSIRRRIEQTSAKVRGASRPRVMVVIGESGSDGSLKSLFLSGTDGFYNQIVEIVGGRNVVTDTTLGITGVSAEGVIALAPDIIIEVVPANGAPRPSKADVLKAWERVPSVPAVRNGKIYVVDQDYVSVPGPRASQVIDDFLRYIHPEIS